MKKRKKCGFLIRITKALWITMLCLCLCSGCAVQKNETKGFRIVTSFYPIYIMAWNLTDGIDGVELANMAKPSTGCLHDYQLRPKDLVCLDGADLFLTNGGGMESFLADALEAYPSLKVYAAIDALDPEELIQEEDEINPHTWMDPTLYRKELAYFCKVLIENDPTHKEQYEKNYALYDQKLEELQPDFAQKKTSALILHESFPYLLRTCKIQLAGAVDVEKDSGFSAKEIRQLVDVSKESHADYILSDNQYSGRISELLAEETGMEVWKLDSAVSGEYEKDAYLKSMKHNYAIIKKGIGGAKDED